MSQRRRTGGPSAYSQCLDKSVATRPVNPFDARHGVSPIAVRYDDAGVDIATGNAFVEAIRPLAASTARPGSLGTLGGFGGLFDPKAAGYDDPVLVAGADGVGTKLMVATAAARHDTVGIDLVAMCVNDLVVQGAEPLLFLDYYAAGTLDAAVAAAVVAGIADGCREAGCALVGGETTELPGLYRPGDYDLAGFALGAVERDGLLPRTDPPVAPGDVALGLTSSGLHANGYSLVRRIVADAGLALDAPAPFAPDNALADILLTPTRLYVRAALAAARAGLIKAFAHITGGGLIENVARALPDDCTARLDAAAWPVAPVFGWLAATGPVAADEMARTFNCGIGMVAITAPDRASAAASVFADAGETVSVIGEVVIRDGTGAPVTISGLERALAAGR